MAVLFFKLITNLKYLNKIKCMISVHLTNMLQKDTYNEDMNMYCKQCMK